jgi:hypothetical protein
VLASSVPVTAAQSARLDAARRGFTVLAEFERPELLKLFPEKPFGGKGLLGALGGAARAKVFDLESRVRAMSDEQYAQLRTTFAISIPAMARAAGEVGNLSETEQEMVREGVGIARTREAFAGGLRAYRRIFERAFEASGIPVPQGLRGTGGGGRRTVTTQSGKVVEVEE